MKKFTLERKGNITIMIKANTSVECWSKLADLLPTESIAELKDYNIITIEEIL